MHRKSVDGNKQGKFLRDCDAHLAVLIGGMDGLVQQAVGRNRAIGRGESERARMEGGEEGRCVRGDSLYVEDGQRQKADSYLMTGLTMVSQVHGL